MFLSHKYIYFCFFFTFYGKKSKQKSDSKVFRESHKTHAKSIDRSIHWMRSIEILWTAFVFFVKIVIKSSKEILPHGKRRRRRGEWNQSAESLKLPRNAPQNKIFHGSYREMILCSSTLTFFTFSVLFLFRISMKSKWKSLFSSSRSAFSQFYSFLERTVSLMAGRGEAKGRIYVSDKV